jgi:hypothetical protein
MKKLSQLEISWPESIAVQIMTQWASLYNVVSCKTLIDGVIACFHDLYDAIRFCVGAYVQVEEYYSVLSNISGIDTGLIGAISEGEIAQFETMAGTEITGSTIALAATIGKIKGTINFDPKIAEARATDFGSWGIDSGFTIGSGAALLDAHKAFEFLFIKGPI